MVKQAKWVRGEHFERKSSFSLDVPAREVFPLLCPVREYEWIPDWSCRMIYSQSGVAEKGAVFTTVEKPFGRMLWTCVVYDPPTRIEYLLTLNSNVSIVLELALTEMEGGCDVSWIMKFTTSSWLMGFLLRRRMSEKKFSELIGLREKQLAEFFSIKHSQACTNIAPSPPP